MAPELKVKGPLKFQKIKNTGNAASIKSIYRDEFQFRMTDPKAKEPQPRTFNSGYTRSPFLDSAVREQMKVFAAQRQNGTA